MSMSTADALTQPIVRCFTEVTPEAAILFQVVDLGRQIYVWTGVGGAKLQNLYLAIASQTVRPQLPCR